MLPTTDAPAPLSPQRLTLPGEGGIQLNVWDYGGDGPVLLLAHCTGAMARAWDPVVRHLSPHFRCIAPDTRGQGDSESPATRDGYVWKLSGFDLLRVVDFLGVQSPIVAAGHSAGGAHVAYAEHHRPGVFERVILVDGIIGPEVVFSAQYNPLPDLARRRVNVFPSLEAARERFVAKPPMKTWVPEAVELYLRHGLRQREDGQWELKTPGDREAWFYELGGASDIFEELDAMPVRTLIVTGEHSDARVLAELQHQLMPHAAFHVVPGAGHFLVQEVPDVVAREIQAWAMGT